MCVKDLLVLGMGRGLLIMEGLRGVVVGRVFLVSGNFGVGRVGVYVVLMSLVFLVDALIVLGGGGLVNVLGIIVAL